MNKSMKYTNQLWHDNVQCFPVSIKVYENDFIRNNGCICSVAV